MNKVDGGIVHVSICISAVFSAVTLLLLPHSQGNIWLFEDTVLITRKLPGRFYTLLRAQFTFISQVFISSPTLNLFLFTAHFELNKQISFIWGNFNTLRLK